MITYTPTKVVIFLNILTTVIESIFLCGMGKSFRAKKDGEMIKFDLF